MKSNAGKVGNINLRGKKSMRLSCGCCEMQNFRDREAARVAQQEIDREFADFGSRDDDDFPSCRFCFDGAGCRGYCFDMAA